MQIKLRLTWAFLITLTLTILPMPDVLQGIRPSYVLLLIFYIQFFIPFSFNLYIIFLIGLMLDVLLAMGLGEHVCAILLATWFAQRFALRFRFFPISQQMILICLFSLIYQLTLSLIEAFLNHPYEKIILLGNVLLTMMLWPWLLFLMEGIFKPVEKQAN